jgi:replicative DNA helicase
MNFTDAPSERAVLAGIMRYGTEAYYDVSDIVNTETFTDASNAAIYACLQKVMKEDEQRKIDVPTIMSAAQELGLQDFFNNKEEISHLAAIMKFPVSMDNIRRFGAKIRKLQIARLMYEQLELTQGKYLEVKGDEPISHILGIAEESIFDFTSLLADHEDTPTKLFDDLAEELEERAKNPLDQIGIPTGFDKYDFAIGGGLRKGTISMIGARTKVGKSLIGLNMGIDISKRKIPILYMDTEMIKTDQQNRGAASLSYGTGGQTTIHEIETGKFGKNKEAEELLKLAKANKDLPFYHKNIGGRAFEDQLSIMRRWIAREVGLNDKGKANDCVIVYDYLKLMEMSELGGSKMQEFQLLGFMITSLHNFALRYEVPILLFIQLNRDGIDKESTDAASGSDRVVWIASNFTIYKPKSDEEIAQDGEQYGNRKLVPIIARHGEGLKYKDYINVLMEGKYGKLIEGKTAYELGNVPGEEGENSQNQEAEVNAGFQDIPF